MKRYQSLSSLSNNSTKQVTETSTNNRHSVLSQPPNEKLTTLVNENDRLHQQNETLMKELSEIKSDFERISGVSKKQKSVGNKQDGKQLKQAFDKIDVLIVENDKLTQTIQKLQTQLNKQDVIIRQDSVEYDKLKIRLEQTEQIVVEMDEQLQCKAEEGIDKSSIRSQQDNNKIKSLTESNMRLTKILEDRCVQLENLSRLLNQKNASHQEDLEKYEKQIKQLTQSKQTKNDYIKTVYQLEKEQASLQQEMQHLKESHQKQLRNLKNDHEKCKEENDQLSKDLSAIQQQLQEYYQQIQQKDTIIKQRDDALKQYQSKVMEFQQKVQQQQQQNQVQQQYQYQQLELQSLKSNYQILSTEYQQAKTMIATYNDKMGQLNNLIHNLQSANQVLNEELSVYKSNAPMSNRTNQQQFFSQDSPFKKQNLHALFQAEQSRFQSQSQKKLINPMVYLEADPIRSKSNNRDKFIINE